MKSTGRNLYWARALYRALRSSKARQDVVNELRRRWAGEPPLPPAPIRRIMVICQGNICRSPFAERHLAILCPGLEIRSAGLMAGDGAPAQPGALRVSRQFGIDLSGHAAHRLTTQDVEWADLIIGMQGWHGATVRRSWPAASPKVRLLGDYLPDAPHAVDDPWGSDDEYFRVIFEKIADANGYLSRHLLPASRSDAVNDPV